jgi:hypothetical protein
MYLLFGSLFIWNSLAAHWDMALAWTLLGGFGVCGVVVAVDMKWRDER